MPFEWFERACKCKPEGALKTACNQLVPKEKKTGKDTFVVALSCADCKSHVEQGQSTDATTARSIARMRLKIHQFEKHRAV